MRDPEALRAGHAGRLAAVVLMSAAAKRGRSRLPFQADDSPRRPLPQERKAGKLAI